MAEIYSISKRWKMALNIIALGEEKLKLFELKVVVKCC